MQAAPPDPTIRGTEQIVYHNNSPDTLRALVFKLFMNVHKPGAPRLGGTAADYLTSGTHIDSFSVNGRPQAWGNDANVFTWKVVRLSAPLLPHDSVQLGVAWHYDVANGGGREGIIDPTTYYLAYFYPRVAVYDDYNGWDTMDFTGEQEFYSDFNDYDVSITRTAQLRGVGHRDADRCGAGAAAGAAAAVPGESFTSDTTIHVAPGCATTLAGETTRQDSINTWHFTATEHSRHGVRAQRSLRLGRRQRAGR